MYSTVLPGSIFTLLCLYVYVFPAMMQSLDLNKVDLGIISSAFTASYGFSKFASSVITGTDIILVIIIIIIASCIHVDTSEVSITMYFSSV